MLAEEEVSTDEDMSETFSPDITSDEDLPPM